MLTMRASRPSGDFCCRSARLQRRAIQLERLARWRAAGRRPTSFHDPVSAGSSAMVRTAMAAALAALDAVIQADGRGPRGGILARQRDDLFGARCPVSSAARSGVHSRTRSRSASKPSV